MAHLLNLKLQFKRMPWRLRKMRKNMLPFSMRIVSILGWAAAIVLFVLIMIWALQPDASPPWTGFGKYDPTIPRAKTLWDWLDLLIVPVVLAFTAIWFNGKLRDNDSRIAAERVREENLQTYFDRMSELLLNHNLYKAEKNNDVRFIARARTLTVLRELDSNRKGAILGFLHSTRLIHCSINDKWELTEMPVIGLIGADLSGLSVSTLGGNLTSARLDNILLSDTDLGNANLYHADLSGSVLMSAWLIGANLESAKLCGADLRYAFLVDANIKNADLSKANLTNSIVTSEQLSQVKSLEGSTMPNGKLFDSSQPLEGQCKLQISGERI